MSGTNIIYNCNIYICNTKHLSSVFCAPGQTVWMELNQPPSQPLLWNTGINYVIGQLVIYQDHTYKCLTLHTSIVTWAPGPWTSSLWQLQ